MTLAESDPTAIVEAESPFPTAEGTLLVTLDGTDFSSCALSGSVTRRLNRPALAQIKIPMDCASGCSGPGQRLLVSFDNGSTIHFHGMVMDWELDGGEDMGYITMNAMDPMELWLHRPVRAADGDFSDPEINNLDGATLTGPSMIEAILNNTQTAGGGPPTDAEGPIFLDLISFETGGVELTGAPVDWPMTIGEFVNLLVSTGEVDVVITPTDPGGGVMGELRVYNGDYGTDRSGSVVFEYGTGALNVRALRWNQDMTNICNKLWYYAGPRILTAADPAGDQHWCFNVQGDDPCFNGGVCSSPNAADMEAAFTPIDTCRDDSRTTYGVRMDIQIFDAASDLCVGPGGIDPGRDLYRWNWLAESWARCNPRTLIHITPTRGTAIGAFDIGDLVGVEIGSGICGGASGAQRVYQYTISWDPDGPFELSELQTSSDVGTP